MKFFITLSLIMFSLTFAATAQDTKQNVSPKDAGTFLRVEMENGKAVEIKAADFMKLPRREVKAKNHDGAEVTFAGVDLREVLKLAGVKFGDEGKKANLTSFLIIEAADGYRAVFAMLELEPDFTDKIVLLADTSGGKSLSKEEGSVRLVVPDEKKQARWVRQVVALKIKKI